MKQPVTNMYCLFYDKQERYNATCVSIPGQYSSAVNGRLRACPADSQPAAYSHDWLFYGKISKQTDIFYDNDKRRNNQMAHMVLSANLYLYTNLSTSLSLSTQ